MRRLKLCVIGYLSYIILSSIFSIIDVIMGEGGSGRIYQKFELVILILASLFLFIGTCDYLFAKFKKVNRLILVLLGIFATFLQVMAIIYIFSFFAVFILGPILGFCGFYVTMP